MVQTRSKKNIEEHESPVPAEEDDDDVVEDQSTTPSKPKRKKRQKKRKEELKSKATGVGLKITVDGGSSNKKIVFDDFVPSDNDDEKDDNDNDVGNNETKAIGQQDDVDDDDDNSDVEEVQGTAARDEVLDQMKTEAQQSLKTKKKRKRKARVEKEQDNSDNDDDDAMDEDFFAQLDSAREEELQQKQELAKLQAREAKGKHTTFVFGSKDENASSDPVNVSENIQVVVLNNNQDAGVVKTLVSDTALKYSRNSLKNGIDPLEGEKERKRKKLRSGPQEQPWKRAKKKVALGRSILTKGKPAAFFKRKKR